MALLELNHDGDTKQYFRFTMTPKLNKIFQALDRDETWKGSVVVDPRDKNHNRIIPPEVSGLPKVGEIDDEQAILLVVTWFLGTKIVTRLAGMNVANMKIPTEQG
jgi:hypothetical protein